ncbi:hypothetical protein Hanom_Chr01g00072781 [Helianthus anomalus]
MNMNKRSPSQGDCKFDSKQGRWELGKERVKQMMDAKNICADAR